MYHTNDAGVSLIKSFEGCKLTSYKCPAGVWTVGYGHTGQFVKPGLSITQSEADELLLHDLDVFEAGVENAVGVELNDNQFSALVSFAYNVGIGNFRRSTLLKKLNKGDYAGAAEQFERWNRGGGKVLRGLVRRRKAEKELFLRPM